MRANFTPFLMLGRVEQLRVHERKCADKSEPACLLNGQVVVVKSSPPPPVVVIKKVVAPSPPPPSKQIIVKKG